jgi:hypothetical protein
MAPLGGSTVGTEPPLLICGARGSRGIRTSSLKVRGLAGDRTPRSSRGKTILGGETR